MPIEYYFNSAGAGKIHVSRWEPDGEPIGVVQIVHGIAEHTLRYDDFARYLNSHGYLVVAEDHMGHGKSVGEDGVVGYFSGGWECATDDTYHLLVETKKEFPKLPYVLLGHSMGSFLSRTLLIRHPECRINGCILCGTGWVSEPLIKTGIMTAKAVCSTSGEDIPSSKLQSMAFLGYNRKVEHRRTDFDWLCRDNRVVDEYIADPMCGFDATAGLLRDMFTGMLFNQNPKNLQKMRTYLPILLIAGDHDPVGNYGEGVKKTAQEFRKAGMKQVDVKLYPLCRHELLNEINKQEVYEDTARWISELPGI